MDKRLKWTIIIGTIFILAVPSSNLLAYYIIIHSSLHEDDSMINRSGIYRNIHPTPDSDIDFSYSVKEIDLQDYFLYQFNFSFDILKGVEPNFTRLDQLFNRTQMYLCIRASVGLEFYTSMFVLNMSELQKDNSQVEIKTDMESSLRFENLDVKLYQSSISEEGGITIISGEIILPFRNSSISAENVYDFSGTIHFWINSNSYHLSYRVLLNSTLNLIYCLNSSIGDLELMTGQISIHGKTDNQRFQIGSIDFPYAPTPPGNYSQSSNITLTSAYQHICFEFLIGVEYGGPEIEYEILPIAEILAQQKALEEQRRENFLKSLYTSTSITILIFLIILGSMVNYPRKIS
ncbi:MAG: hypothetical protein JW776_04255 [Candidatus Lokiarchaeota archaeon]|nr:hypothetical protein [Candidatus Lokiarchaeota archaeon]